MNKVQKLAVAGAFSAASILPFTPAFAEDGKDTPAQEEQKTAEAAPKAPVAEQASAEKKPHDPYAITDVQPPWEKVAPLLEKEGWTKSDAALYINYIRNFPVLSHRAAVMQSRDTIVLHFHEQAAAACLNTALALEDRGYAVKLFEAAPDDLEEDQVRIIVHGRSLPNKYTVSDIHGGIVGVHAAELYEERVGKPNPPAPKEEQVAHTP